MDLLRITLILLFSLCDIALSKKKQKSVTTVIDAKWEVTPLALEIAEFLADENEATFWDFMDEVSRLDPPLTESGSDKSYYDRALNASREFLSVPQVSLLEFALSLHVYSPRVEMFNQIGREKDITCSTAVDVAGKIICDLNEVKDAIESFMVTNESNSEEIIRVDHKFPGSNNGKVVFLYGEMGTSELTKFHAVLKDYALAGNIQYILRHWVKDNRNHKKLRLSGYGVELQMKSTEYKVQDDTKVEGTSSEEAEEEEEEVEGFNFSTLKTIYPDKVDDLDKLKQHLLETSSELAPLKVWQFQELSLQAAQRILSAPKDEVLHVLTYISSNFPTQARSLVKTVVSPELKAEMRQNQDRFSSTLHLQPTDTALFINGMYFDLETQDIFTILEYIREELRVMEGLHSIGLTEKKLSKALLALDLNSGGTDFGLDIRDSAVMWLNDIENDKQYRRWSSSLMDLLRPTFPGMLRSVRKNLYNLVHMSGRCEMTPPLFVGPDPLVIRSQDGTETFSPLGPERGRTYEKVEEMSARRVYLLKIVIGDPSKSEVIPLIKLLQSFLIHNAPLRLGIVFAVDDSKTGLEDSGVAMLNAFNYVSEIKDLSQAINFITDVYAAVNVKSITPEDVHVTLKSKFPGFRKDEIFGADSDYNTGLKLSSDFVGRSGLRKFPQVLLNGVPLPDKSLTTEDFEEAVLSEIMHQTPFLQKAVYQGDLTDKDNVVDFIMTQPNIMPRLNERVLSITKNNYIPLQKFSNKLTVDMINDGISYLSQKSDKKVLYLLTNWVVGDLRTEEGRTLFLNAIEHMENSGKIRVGLIINEKDDFNSKSIINKLVLKALRNFPSGEAMDKVKEIINDFPALEAGLRDFSDYGLPVEDAEGLDRILKLHNQFSRDILSLESGKRGIVSNGRFLGPLVDGEEFTLDDFSLLERFSLSACVDRIYSAIATNTAELELITSDMLMKSVSLLASRPESKSRFEIVPYGEEHSVIKLLTPEEGPAFDLVAIVDPVSSGAHKVGVILSTLQQVIRADIKIFLNCVEKNSDMPLKSFYRYVLEPGVQFTASGSLGPGPIARFSNMPGAPLLTQNMLVPDNWMVESVASPHDLDNIKLDQVDSNVHSQFELEYLILEGHCFDTVLGSPPRGLQVTLGTDKNPTEFDTIVMANLGYFQLKANPGLWKLRLRHGRSAALYDITGYSVAGVDYPVNSSEIKAVLSSFKALTIKLKVTKKPDKLGVDLLGEDTEEQQGLWGSITSTFGGSSGDAVETEQEPINIFSLASGHLYERFLRIMMLSVLKNTKSPVKFWFLKNYLSPTFKDFLPRMSKHYGFQYELVQYKWPRWLHQQTEKQRIIWGYKILFLDVLFPLDVKKIIFVDADQVVRADLKELVEFDLGGAPYGYTPFCESRTEMDGFRFWKSGYWRNHLQGRKYHISALYVVDLKRFRRIAAGDRLRGQYQALSQDPNSLSNLDQDLPNNMIHQVAIKSLPQEWLWCETWCDDDSKKRAKTIDLCNNPMTKEAKLTAAIRIVSEWKDYDNEIKQLQLQLGETEDHEEEQLDHSQSEKAQKDTHSHSEL